MSHLRQMLLRRLRSPALRAILAVGMLPKLLIPIGFMPAALADGGPITICGGYGFIAPVAGSDVPAQPAMHDAHAGHATHIAGHGDPMPGTAADPAAVDPGKEHEHHDQWERCVFAGTASSTPLGVDWQFWIAPPGTQLADVSPAILATRPPTVHFRSRAPPTLHS